MKWPQGLLRGVLGVVLIGAGVTIMNKANTDLIPWVVGAAALAVIALFAIQIALQREVRHDPEEERELEEARRREAEAEREREPALVGAKD